MEKAICEVLIHAITERNYIQLDRDILALSVHLGGLCLGKPGQEPNRECAPSVKVTSSQTHQLPDESLVYKSAQQTAKGERAEELKDMIERIRERAPPKPRQD